MKSNFRRRNVVDELVTTESNYVNDVHSILTGYKDVIEGSFIKDKTGIQHFYFVIIPTLLSDDIFGNLEDIYTLHSQSLLPNLTSCDTNLQELAKVFTDLCPDICKLYRT